MLIYLDNCCYGRPYDDQNQMRIHLEAMAKMEIQGMIVRGELELAASGFLLQENGCRKDENIRLRNSRYIDGNLSIYIDDDDPGLDALIDEIMATGIKSMDASHLAAAIVAGCDCFITTDDRILKYKDDRIRVMDPVQFLQEVCRCIPNLS